MDPVWDRRILVFEMLENEQKSINVLPDVRK